MDDKLKITAGDVFRRFPKENKVFVTSDGQAFFDETHAKNHATNNRRGNVLKIETFLRSEIIVDAVKIEKMSAKDMLAQIAAAESVEAVTALSEAEKAGENRKSVIEASEKKIADLLKTKEA